MVRGPPNANNSNVVAKLHVPVQARTHAMMCSINQVIVFAPIESQSTLQVILMLLPIKLQMLKLGPKSILIVTGGR